MATPEENLARFQEIANRGLQDRLDPQKRAIFDEALRRQLITVPQSPGILEQGLGAVEVAKTIGTSIVAEPVSGLAGIAGAVLPGEQGQGAEWVEKTRDFLTSKPRTQAGQQQLQAVGEFLQPVGEAMQTAEQFTGDIGYAAGDVVGAPELGGAVGATIPTAILEAIGLKGSSMASRIPARQGKRAAKLGKKLAKEADDILADAPTELGAKNIVESIKTGKADDIAMNLKPDAEFYKAMDELGITTEPLASFASQNPQYVAVENALRAIPGSALDAQAKGFIADVSKKADDLIQQYGGTLDKAELSARFKADALRTIDDIYGKEDVLYSSIDLAVPKRTKVVADNTIAYLDDLAADLGGVDELPRNLRTLRESLTKEGGPTSELLNTRRREVGQQIGRKGDTQFKNMETGQLKGLYRAMKEDQNLVAKNAGMDDVAESANALTIQRKQLEDNLKTLLGKDMQKDLMPEVSTAVKGLGKGKVEAFNQKIKQIPEGYRQEVVTSALNDIFRGTRKGTEGMDMTQFTKFMNELDRSPATKNALYVNLDPGARKAVESLRKIAKGVSDAGDYNIKTGVVTALFDDQRGMMKNLIGTVGGMIGTKTAGPMAGWGVKELLTQSTDQAKAATNMLADTKFQNTLGQIIREGVAEGNTASKKLLAAEKALQKSKSYNVWAKTLKESDKIKLANVGLIGYLLQESKEEQE